MRIYLELDVYQFVSECVIVKIEELPAPVRTYWIWIMLKRLCCNSTNI